MLLNFTKMNGAGNDFIMLDNRSGSISLSKEQIAKLCDRHRGIGADGLLLVEDCKVSNADFRMRYYNSDGGEAEMCGNGARCFARFASRLTSENSDKLSFETQAGIIGAKLHADQSVELAMGTPHSWQPPTLLKIADTPLEIASLNTGVPHAVVLIENNEKLQQFDIQKNGSEIRYHHHFAPKGTNVNFYAISSPGSLVVRTYERGVEEETLACGTGVVATALSYHLRTNTPSPIQVDVRGGETLSVSFEPLDNATFQNVTLQGPADFVFEGKIEL
ncbi:MAG: diaminopimelate epimerase [Chthoniobacterales bacterium]